jgi:hypothetical protein
MIKKLVRFWTDDHGLTLFLIILIIDIFLMGPMVRSGLVLDLAGDVLYSLLLLAGIFTVVHRQTLRSAAGALVAVTIAVRWCSIAFASEPLTVLNAALSLASVLAFLVLVLWSVFRPGPVTGNRVRGAIAAYLMLALCFSLAYDLVAHVHPAAFTLTALGGQRSQVRAWTFLYFSVVTLTTVGFGDITAIHPVARSLVMAEAFMGQLYPAILLARLVTLEMETRRSRKKKKDAQGE